MSKRWTSVSLKGDSQMIPLLCPSTLRPADLKLRYGYVRFNPLTWWSTFYQTFHYAEDAGQAVQAYLKYRTLRLWWWLFVLIVLTPGAWILTLVEIGSNSSLFFLGWAVPLACLGIGVLVTFRMRRRAMARHPLPKDAISWRPSAYYVGSGLNVFARRAVYKARRPEWIRALVEANPDAVDNATYARITGSARPLAEAEKPFA